MPYSNKNVANFFSEYLGFGENSKQQFTNMGTIKNQMKDAYEIIENISSEHVKDDCDLFGEQLAMKLREFDEHTRAIVMNEINYIIFLAESNLL